MNLGTAEFQDRLAMLPRSVSLVAEKIVLWKLAVVHLHQPVPRHLCHDGRRRYGEAPGIAANDGFLLYGEINAVQTVDQEIIGRRGKFENRVLHGSERRLQDIHGVDHGRLDDADADGDRIPLDDPVEPFPLSGRELLGIGDLGMFISGRQNHGGGNDGSRQRAATRLVDPGDDPITASAGFAFKDVHPPDRPRPPPSCLQQTSSPEGILHFSGFFDPGLLPS